MKPSFYEVTRAELFDEFKRIGLPPSGPDLLFNWHYKKRQSAPCVIDLAKKSISYMSENYSFELPSIHTAHESSDKTVKFLMELHDGLKIECVLIPFNGKYTICLSSQVGCAMNCSFCFTAVQGLKRHLGAHEIVGQFLVAQAWLTQHRPGDDRILNIVFMGQGEPLHNFDAVKKSCEIFLDRHGLCLAPHKITISTAGYLPGLERFKTEMPNVNIAISLHSTVKEKRDQLIPLNRRYPIEEIDRLAQAIPEGRTRFVTYEYMMIDGFNDSDEDAHLTGRFLQGKKAYISLIPFNPIPGTSYKRPSMESVGRFKSILDEYQIPTLIRKTKGDQILAACGQLNSR